MKDLKIDDEDSLTERFSAGRTSGQGLVKPGTGVQGMTSGTRCMSSGVERSCDDAQSEYVDIVVLRLPHLSNVTKILSVDKGWVTVEANQENMIVKESLRMPCLICMDSEINTPRLPSYRRKKALDGSLIHSLTLNDLEDKDSTHYGLKGSPTQVQKVFPPEKSTSRVMVEGSSEELAQKLNDLLADRKFI